MKSKLLLFVILCFNLSFGQNNTSRLAVLDAIPPVSLGITAQPVEEIFRFRPGLVTQLDNLSQNFGFTDSRWFAMGRINAGLTQTFYGSRFQTPNNALVMGYVSSATIGPNSNPNNPRIEWISNANRSSLEFRVGLSFGSPGAPGANILVASMSKDGTTTFGDPNLISSNPRVVINNNADIGFKIESLTQTHGAKTGFLVNQPVGTNVNIGGDINVGQTTFESTGLRVNAFTSQDVTGVRANATDGTANTIGVLGEATPSFSTLGFAAGIYGRAINFNNQQWAGFFDGRLFSTGMPVPSDSRLKDIIEPADPFMLPRLMQLKPVMYTFKDIKELNLPKSLQHGFIAQDVEKVFPELVTEISKPTFNDKGVSNGEFTFKAMEYTGFTSLLVAGIQELYTKLQKLEEELASFRSANAATQLKTNEPATNGVFMNQNIPNPFTDQTTINYQLPEGTTTADLLVFDLNGTLIKTYPINKNQSEITIKAADIGSGLFIYSLVQNGQELVTKKMIVR